MNPTIICNKYRSQYDYLLILGQQTPVVNVEGGPVTYGLIVCVSSLSWKLSDLRRAEGGLTSHLTKDQVVNSN